MKLSKNGVALIMVYVLILVLAVLGTVFFSRTASEHSIATISANSTRAFWLAEAGINRALWELNNGDGNWTGWQDVGSDTKTLQNSLGGSGDFSVSVVDFSTDNPQITSIGFFPNITAPDSSNRTIEVMALHTSGSLFDYAAFGDADMTMSGQAETDSYDSEIGGYNEGGNIGENGDVATNGDIAASGQVYIGGNANTGPEGTFEEEDYVAGEITHESDETLSLITVPDALLSLPSGGNITSTQTINAGDYKFDSIDLSGENKVTIIGPSNIYLTSGGSLELSGQSEVIISDASTGAVNIYADGDVTISGQGVANQTTIPSNFIIFGTGTGSRDITFTGQADFYGAIYAPTAEMTISGQGELFGAFSGESVTMSGQAKIHYDEALGRLDLGLGSGRFIIQSWQEI